MNTDRPVDVRADYDRHRRTIVVTVDGRFYDGMTVKKGTWITESQVRDIEAGYREGLTLP